jgi:hypothetical protein
MLSKSRNAAILATAHSQSQKTPNKWHGLFAAGPVAGGAPTRRLIWATPRTTPVEIHFYSHFIHNFRAFVAARDCLQSV